MPKSPYRTFAYEYRFNNAIWAFNIQALDRDEADERVRILSIYGQYVGEVGHTIVAPRGLTWLAYLITWFKNWLERRKH